MGPIWGLILAVVYYKQPSITQEILSQLRRALAAKLADLERHLKPAFEHEDVLPGVVTVSRHRCGNAGCACTRQGKLHEAVRILINWGKVEQEFAYASYDALRNLFNADGGVPEDGLRLVIDQARRSAKVTREVAASEVADFTFLREAQAELGIKGR